MEQWWEAGLGAFEIVEQDIAAIVFNRCMRCGLEKAFCFCLSSMMVLPDKPPQP